MINAKEISALTKEGKDSKVKSDLQAIERRIKIAAAQGKYSAQFAFEELSTRSQTIPELVAQGFTIFEWYPYAYSRVPEVLVKWYADAHLPPHEQEPIDLSTLDSTYKLHTMRSCVGKQPKRIKRVDSEVVQKPWYKFW